MLSTFLDWLTRRTKGTNAEKPPEPVKNVRLSADGKIVGELSFGAHSDIWAQAISTVLHEKGVAATVEFEGQVIAPDLNPTELVPDEPACVEGVDVITLENPRVCGPGRRSPNGKYSIVRRPDVQGEWALADGLVIIQRGVLPRPDNGHLSNSGVFSLCTWNGDAANSVVD